MFSVNIFRQFNIVNPGFQSSPSLRENYFYAVFALNMIVSIFIWLRANIFALVFAYVWGFTWRSSSLDIVLSRVTVRRREETEWSVELVVSVCPRLRLLLVYTKFFDCRTGVLDFARCARVKWDLSQKGNILISTRMFAQRNNK